MLPLIFFSLLIGINGNSYGCPNNVTCYEKETCCQTNTGLVACCPIESAVCCDDGIHCCGKDQKCSPDGNCTTPTNEIFPSHPLHIHQIELTGVTCPDQSVCQNGSSCCQLASGHYGCCPILDAVCCSDHLHCCPHGYTCDGEHSRCKKKFELNDVPCPGGSSACPDGETCCKLGTGDYGCCPLVDAVCCSDHLHCCPHGSTCDVEKGQCDQDISIPWFTKTPSIRREHKLIKINNNDNEINQISKLNTDIICPDATSLCPSTSTCCITTASTWGCCPIEKAVCCADHIHCCPTHYKCDLHIFKCDHPFGSIPLLKKEKSLKKLSVKLIDSNSQSSVSTIQCPDEKSLCPEETTCCQLNDGSYGCCPYPDASCCSDKIHCCGNGYSCDITGKRCTKTFDSLNKTESMPLGLKMKSFKKDLNIKSFLSLNPLKDQTCPDGKTTCSPTTTCCPNKENDQVTYSCCPYSKGVCCGTNGSVCCPNGYSCDEKQLSCQLGNSRFARSLRAESDFSQCGSSQFGCSSAQTCCRTYGSPDGEYACCNFPDAQCCEDGQHCCPKGSRCDTQYGGCIQNN
ncbi:unnamed protein product [Adineta steineri]|uniref:Granulins domain-containing protein n=1 Tax=Adineta steineri TaxID=433720 RepID=A0A815AQQ5_9BILA|nr:unnamed protein product [Adineta steineri]CAF1549740.1 unnamed protein product [Adineta steineri]